MFKTIRLGALLGIPLTAHWSLPLLAAWFVASAWNAGGPEAAGIAAITIFIMVVSVTAHEFGHVLAARYYGIGTKSINLSPIGGIAFLDRYPGTPGQKAAVALAGPAVSLVLALVFGTWAVMSHSPEKGLGSPVDFMFLANLLLLLFNLLPVYPMDGGQVLDAITAKAFGKPVARKVSSWTGHLGASSMLGLGFYLPNVSLGVIGAFLLAVVSFELGNPVTRAFGHDPEASKRKSGKESQPGNHGIFVAFDAEGRHFAYAKHWLDCPGDELEQQVTVAAYISEAREKGGEVRLLSPVEFREQVLMEAEAA